MPSDNQRGPMQTVYSAANISLVSIFQSILEERGITCWIKNEFLLAGVGEIPPIESWPQLCVEDSDYSEAKRIVDETLAAKKMTSFWKCDSCGENIEDQFTECWNCGKSRPEPNRAINEKLSDVRHANNLLKKENDNPVFIKWHKSPKYKDKIKILGSIIAFLIIAGAIGFFIGTALDKESNKNDKRQVMRSFISCTCTSGDCNNGQGTLTISSGSKYVGEFKDGKYNGQGTFTWDNTDKYIGEFKNSKLQGHGTLIRMNGNKYVGEFKDGKYNGQGTFTWANNDKYVGEFKNDKLQGYGTLIRMNGSKYIGEFKDGKYNGQGTFTWANGSRYVGEFKDGKINGQGTMSNSDGTKTQRGRWENNKYVGE